MNRTVAYWALLGTAANTIGLACYAFLRYPDPLLRLHCASAVLLMLAPSSVLLREGKRGVERGLRLRIYADQWVILPALAIRQYFPSVAFVYLTSSAIHFIVAYALPWDRRTFSFLRVMAALSLAGVWNLREDLLAAALFASLQVISVVIHGELVRQREQHAAEERQAQEIRNLELRLLTHDINNIATMLFMQIAAVDEVLARQFRHRIDRIAEAVRGIHGTAVEVNLSTVLRRTVEFCREHLNREIELSVLPPQCLAVVKPQVLISALVNVIANAHEAGAQHIEVELDDGLISVRDNGPGFDVAQMKLGHTTKVGGHGIGLVTSVEALQQCQVLTTIDSAQGRGTTVTFHFDEGILRRPGA